MDHRAQIAVVESDLTVEHVFLGGGKMLEKSPPIPILDSQRPQGIWKNWEVIWTVAFPLRRPYGGRFAESSGWQIRWLYLLEGLSQRCDCGPGLSFLSATSDLDSFNINVCIGFYRGMSKSFEVHAGI